MIVSLWVAATVVGLIQFLRVRDKRLLPLLALFLFLALAHSRDWWDPWQKVLEIAAAVAGLLQLFVLPPRPLPPERP